MTEQQIANALAFLQRVQISGAEAIALVDVMSALRSLREGKNE